jgi:hypothetical protein
VTNSEVVQKSKKAQTWKKWRANNPRTEAQKSKKADAQRKWRKDNPEVAKKLTQERYQKDPQAARARVQKWRKDHPEQWSQIQRASNLRTKYGISVEEFDALLLSQGGCCAICGSSDSQMRKKKGKLTGCFAVDHDHETGKVRGLLCGHCNTGLGLLRDNVEILKKALVYLSK